MHNPHNERLAGKLVAGAKVFESMFLVASVLVNNEKVLLMLAHDEALVKLPDHTHVPEPLLAGKVKVENTTIKRKILKSLRCFKSPMCKLCALGYF